MPSHRAVKYTAGHIDQKVDVERLRVSAHRHALAGGNRKLRPILNNRLHVDTRTRESVKRQHE